MFRLIASSFVLCVLALHHSEVSAAAPVKARQVTLKEVESSPETFLGNRIVVNAWLGNGVKGGGDGAQELQVYHDANTQANRLRVLAARSLAEQVKGLSGVLPVTLTGVIAAPESVRAGYSFEVEEIVVRNAEGQPTATLKPAVIAAVAGDRPPVEAPKATEPTKPKAADPQKKSDKLPTLLVLLAGGLAVFMLVSGVVGVRLLKHLKKSGGAPTAGKKPAPSRIKISAESR